MWVGLGCCDAVVTHRSCIGLWWASYSSSLKNQAVGYQVLTLPNTCPEAGARQPSLPRTLSAGRSWHRHGAELRWPQEAAEAVLLRPYPAQHCCEPLQGSAEVSVN